jgi:hypothetical protein
MIGEAADAGLYEPEQIRRPVTVRQTCLSLIDPYELLTGTRAQSSDTSSPRP